MSRQTVFSALLYFILFGAVVLPGKLMAEPIEWPANGHFYQRIDARNIEWSAAEDAAEAMSTQGLAGHLVTITSQAEQDFVMSNLLQDVPGSGPREEHYWLGGYRNLAESDWHWVTGEEWDFTQWAPGEPNDWSGSETALHVFWIAPEIEDPTFRAKHLMWNDLSGQQVGDVWGYIVEYSEPVPEPSGLFLLTAAFGVIYGRFNPWRRRRILGKCPCIDE